MPASVVTFPRLAKSSPIRSVVIKAEDEAARKPAIELAHMPLAQKVILLQMKDPRAARVIERLIEDAIQRAEAKP